MEYSRVFIGKRIREERNLRDWSIEKLAEKVELSPSFLGVVERGKKGLSIKKFIEVADALGISLDDLIRRKAEPDSRFYKIKTLLEDTKEEDFKFICEFLSVLIKRLNK